MVDVVDIVLGSPVSLPYRDEAKPVVLKEDSTAPSGYFAYDDLGYVSTAAGRTALAFLFIEASLPWWLRW